MIVEAIASAELAQPIDRTWCQRLLADGYPCNQESVSREKCSGIVLCHRHNEGLDVEPLYTEDLSALPPVERAAIACSMVACGLSRINLDEAVRAVGDDGLFGVVDHLVLAARGLTYSEYMSYEDRHALAEAMLRTGEVEAKP